MTTLFRVLAGVAILHGLSATAQSAFPPKLEKYFSAVLKLTAENRKTLQSGATLTKELEADPEKEGALFGAVWVAAPRARYVAALNEIEKFEAGGGFRATKKISEPARLED